MVHGKNAGLKAAFFRASGLCHSAPAGMCSADTDGEPCCASHNFTRSKRPRGFRAHGRI